MKKNMGSADVVIRLLVAAIFAGLYLTHQVTGVAGYILLGIATVFLLTGLLSFCPLYTLAGISTAKRSRP